MTILVLVESPSKAKKIQQYMGSGYIVKATVGHVLDLPKKGFGIDLNTMEETYDPLPGKQDTIRDLKKLAKSATEVIFASDPDREGEAIAWHLENLLKPAKSHRIEIHEITEKGIKHAMAGQRKINYNLVEAQRARRELDRILGYGISPLLMRAVNGAKSAGRVQSAALRLIVERNRENEKFVPQDRFSVEGLFVQSGNTFKASLQESSAAVALIAAAKDDDNDSNKKKRLTLAASPDVLLSELKKIAPKDWSVTSVDERKTTIKPQPPLTTSSMQQLASRRFGWSGEQTMKHAQELFIGGHITYHRTDSVRVEPDAQAGAIAFIQGNYGKDMVPATPNMYKTKGNAQDAHEAIRPTHIEAASVLSGDAAKLYEVIRGMFLASQAAPGVNTLREVKVTDPQQRFTFASTATHCTFEGFRKFVAERDEDDSNELSAIKKGSCESKGLSVIKSQTKPRPNYREDTLLKDLEKFGIGRPSSYASIVSTLLRRTYVGQKKRDLISTETGRQANDWMVQKSSRYTETDYTAKIEQMLDDISEGTHQRVPFLKDIYQDLVGVFGPMNTGGGGGGDGRPTLPQLDLIRKISEEQGIEIPASVLENMAEAKQFLDVAMLSRRPSAKQIDYARQLAEKLSIKLSDDVLQSSIKTSEFIEKAKKSSSKLDFTPTAPMLKFAKSLAEQHNKVFTAAMAESGKQTKKFIDECTGGGAKKKIGASGSKGSRYPSPAR